MLLHNRADDIALLAPSIQAMWQMLNLCGQYARDYILCSMLANLTVSLLFSRRHGVRKAISNTAATSFYISGKKIDVVEKWRHLGHIISKDVMISLIY